MTVDLDLYRRVFVSRDDVFAVATKNKPGYRCVREALVDRVLEGHLEGRFSVGSYLVLPGENKARLIVLDIDIDRKKAIERLIAQAGYFLPKGSIVVERTGGRGWHIWLLFDSWIEAAKLRIFGERLVTDANCGVKIEVFPKGTEVEQTGFGTMVRLPLGKHPRTGEEGELFAPDFEPLDLNEVFLCPEISIPALVIGEPGKTKAVLSKVGKWPCIVRLEQGVLEGQRDEAMFALACHYRDQGLSSQVTLKAVQDANERNIPPLPTSVITEKVESAYENKTKIGCSTPVLHDFCKKDLCWLHRFEEEGIHRRTWIVGDLMRADIPPLRWVVQDMLPQGFALLSGKPKIGKSWFVLDLAISVASGSDFLGHPTRQGAVLLLALEDGEARLQDRLRHFDIPEGLPLQIEFDFSRFGDGGYADLEEVLLKGLDGNPFRLVIIDCLARAKSTKREELSAEDMELIVRPLQSWGHVMEVCFLVVHHHRKSATGDVIWDPRGSGAIVGVADVAMGIYQEEDKAYKFVTRSRDAPELSYWLSFEEGRWRREDDEFGLRAKSEAIGLALQYVEEHGIIDAKILATLSGQTVRTCQTQLNLLSSQGRLIVDRGKRPYCYRMVVEQGRLNLEKEIDL